MAEDHKSQECLECLAKQALEALKKVEEQLPPSLIEEKDKDNPTVTVAVTPGVKVEVVTKEEPK